MDDDLPLASLAKKIRKKKTLSKRTSRSPTRSKRRRAVLRAYGLDARLLGEVTNIQDFIADHPKDVTAKIGFVILGSYPVLIEKQAQLDALPPGDYNAQVIYAHPTQTQLETFERRNRTSGVAKASRPK